MSTSSYTAPVPGCRGSNLAIVSLSTSCLISLKTFQSEKPSSYVPISISSVSITNTAIFLNSRPPQLPTRLKIPAKPRQLFNFAQFRHLSSRHTFYAAKFYPVRQIKTFPPPAHMSMSCLLLLTVFLYCTLFLMFYPVYHKTVQIPPNSEQFHSILFHNFF